ncbi:Uncharacterised protein r2_g599 [Pycnogonum litorale]
MKFPTFNQTTRDLLAHGPIVIERSTLIGGPNPSSHQLEVPPQIPCNPHPIQCPFNRNNQSPPKVLHTRTRPWPHRRFKTLGCPTKSEHLHNRKTPCVILSKVHKTCISHKIGFSTQDPTQSDDNLHGPTDGSQHLDVQLEDPFTLSLKIPSKVPNTWMSQSVSSQGGWAVVARYSTQLSFPFVQTYRPHGPITG